MTITMRSGHGLERYTYEGTAIVDSDLNEVVLECGSERLSCGALVPLDFKAQRVRVTIELVAVTKPVLTVGVWALFKRWLS